MGGTRGSARTNSHYFSLVHRLRDVERLVIPTLEPHIWALDCTSVCVVL